MALILFIFLVSFYNYTIFVNYKIVYKAHSCRIEYLFNLSLYFIPFQWAI